MDTQKSKKRPRVSKYIEFGKAHFPRVCKDIQGYTRVSLAIKKIPNNEELGEINPVKSRSTAISIRVLQLIVYDNT